MPYDKLITWAQPVRSFTLIFTLITGSFQKVPTIPYVEFHTEGIIYKWLVLDIVNFSFFDVLPRYPFFTVSFNSIVLYE